MVDLEGRGLVGIVVASDAFVQAAKVQSDALGFAPECIFVPHPIQDRNDEEIQELAAEAEASLLAALQG